VRRRTARIAALLVDEARSRLEARGVEPPATGVIFDEVWDLARTLAARERSLEQAADWHTSLSQGAQAVLDEGMAAVVGRLVPPPPVRVPDERRLVELDPLAWRVTLECLPPSAAELAGYDLAIIRNGGREQ
jgi:hypothetical protein